MNRILAIVSVCVLFGFPAVAAKYQITVSKNRKDGVMIDVQPRYPYLAQLYVTMSPELCMSAGTTTPLPEKNASILIKDFNYFLDPTKEPTVFFHQDAPAGVNLCYMLVGRGQVELTQWGYRKADWEDQDLKPNVLGLSASKNRSDAVEIMFTPALTEFSDLYLTPVEDNNCPDVGHSFNFKGRWMKAMPEPFNGKYYLHTKAPLGVDLCYFIISKKTKLALGKAIGYREP